MKKSKSFIALCKKHYVDPDLIPEITSFEDACVATNTDPGKLPVVDHLPKVYQKHLIADYKLCIIAKALNGDWEPDYTSSQWKYFAVFTVEANDSNRSGFGLSCRVCGGWASSSNVGVRLCFPNSDLAEYFGKQFLQLHADHHLYT